MCPADKQTFSSFAHAQVAITNEVYQHLGEPETFLFCPTGTTMWLHETDAEEKHEQTGFTVCLDTESLKHHLSLFSIIHRCSVLYLQITVLHSALPACPSRLTCTLWERTCCLASTYYGRVRLHQTRASTRFHDHYLSITFKYIYLFCFPLGPKVVSHKISVESIEEVSSVLKRAPVIWDNIHANDYDPQRLFLGPYKVHF